MTLSSSTELQPSPVSYLMLPFFKANITSLSAFCVLYIGSVLVIHMCSSWTWEAKVGGIPGVWGQVELHLTLFQKIKQNNLIHIWRSKIFVGRHYSKVSILFQQRKLQPRPESNLAEWACSACSGFSPLLWTIVGLAMVHHPAPK